MRNARRVPGERPPLQEMIEVAVHSESKRPEVRHPRQTDVRLLPEPHDPVEGEVIGVMLIVGASLAVVIRRSHQGNDIVLVE